MWINASLPVASLAGWVLGRPDRGGEAVGSLSPYPRISREIVMDAPCDATLLRIFVGNDDVFNDKPLYDQIMIKARDMALAGATVTRGILAFGPGSQEFGGALRFSEDLPVVIEIVDSDEKIRAFLPAIEDLLESALVLTQKVSVARHGRKSQIEGGRG
ncbi:MAG TPA: DUF190 domain-containing protein [Stellaceae bacterium]|nr:DUF190 domain-containing protein [Stellaceae bacterium]